MGQLTWYIARASGIVAWALMAAGVLWGLAISTKSFRGRAKPHWMLDLHRFLGGAGVVLIGVHLASLVADSYAHVGPAQILVPFTSAYRPAAVAWGVVALYTALAVDLTSLLRKRLSKRVWRMTHALSFPMFLAATAHGITAGADSGSPIMRAAYIGVAAAVAALTTVRVVGVLEAKPAPVRTPVRTTF